MPREDALAALESLRSEFLGRDLTALNEANTRLLIVDRVLAALGWRPEEFNPETRAGKSGFSDYLLSVDGVPQVVVEAKRTGKTFGSSRRLARTEYAVPYLRSAFGREFTEVLQQAEGYALEHGVQAAVVTNGNEWFLIQVNKGPTAASDELKGFSFGRLLEENANFNHLWELLSRDSVGEASHLEALSDLNTRPFEYTRVPIHELGATLSQQGNPEPESLASFYSCFMDEMVDPGRRRMLEKCFVADAKLAQYDGNLRRLLKDSAPAFVANAEELSPGDGKKLVLDQTGDQRGQVVLVTGSVGCGKSTFVTRALVAMKQSGDAVPLLLNFIDEVDVTDTEVTTSMLWGRVHRHWRKEQPGTTEYSELRTMFHGEVDALRRGAESKIFARSPERFEEAEAALLKDLANEPETFLSKCWRRWRKQQGKSLVVFLDNVDRASEHFQRVTYAFAHALAAATGATVIVPMREMTFFRGKTGGFLDIRSSDVIYHLQAPDPIQVLSKRVKYVLDHIEQDHRISTWRKRQGWETLYGCYRQHAETIREQVLSSKEGKGVVQMASSIAWHDIRLFLAVVRRIHKSLNGRAWRTGTALAAVLINPEGDPLVRVPNLYEPPYPSYPCTFLRTRVLAFLLRGHGLANVTTGVGLQTITHAMRMYGYRTRWTEVAVESMVRERLLECLQGPSAAEYSKSYKLDRNHVFRPSPLAVTLVEDLQFQPEYLAIMGSQVTFHDQLAYEGYIRVAREISVDGGSASFESASRAVGSWLRSAYLFEDVPGGKDKNFPQIAAINDQVDQVLRRLPGEPRRIPESPRRPSPGALDQLSLPNFSGGNERVAQVVPELTQPLLGIPSTIRQATVGNSRLSAAIFWALCEARERGQASTTGAEVTRLMNKHVFSDQEKKEPTNVSRALRSNALRSQPWLRVFGKQGSWRYAVEDEWKATWKKVFAEPPR